MRRHLVFLVLSAGCGAGAAPVAPEPEAPRAASVAIVSGIYHRVGAIDAANLSLDLHHGTFHWGINGCDFVGSDFGAASREGDAIVLESERAWPSGTATLRADGSALILETQIGDELDHQRWEPGGVCPVCTGGLSPSAEPIPCDEPYFGE
jgi:hypothetical protein